MPSNTEKLLSVIKTALSDYERAVNNTQKKGYQLVLTNLNRLEYKNDRLIQNTNNVKVLGRMKNDLNKLLRSPLYVNAVKKLGESFNIIETLQNEYFESLVENFKPSGAAKIAKRTAVLQMVDNLVGGGVNQEVTNKAANILLANMQSGSNVMQVTESLREFMLTTSKTAGSLSKYSGQIATDSINQYAAAYNQQVIEDLDFEWFQYVGSLRDTSRDFCVALVKQRYIHKSELSKAAKGVLRDVTVSTAGMYPQTNGGNLTVLRGGYRCHHQFRGVTTSNVPKSIRDKVTPTK